MKKLILILPLLLTIILSIFLLIFLLQNKDPAKPPSALLNKDLPKFNLTSLFDEKDFLDNNNLNEKIVMINFFASWCAPCKTEHHLFFKIKKQNPNLFLIGINFKDDNSNAIKYLTNNGNPYDFVAKDTQGLFGLELGVFGLPETFLINSSGKIIYKYIGPITKKIIKNEIYPLIK